MKPGPGKFEGCDDLETAERLYRDALDSSFEEEYGSVEADGFWMCRIGKFLCYEDSQGFFDYSEFPTEEEAKAAFEKEVEEREHEIEEPVEVE